MVQSKKLFDYKVVRRIYNRNTKFTSVDKLKIRIINVQNKIKPKFFSNLAECLRNRIFQVFNKNGKLTNY